MWSFYSFGAECMLYVDCSTPGEQSWGQMMGNGKAYGQFTGNIKSIDELLLIFSLNLLGRWPSVSACLP